MSGIQFTCVGGVFSKVLFFLGKISLRALFTLSTLLLLLLRTFVNLSISLKMESSVYGWYRGWFSRNLNASVTSGNDFHASHADFLLTLAKETRGRVSSSDWMKHRECPRCFRSKKRAGGIHTYVLDIFPHAHTNPDGCSNISWENVSKNWKTYIFSADITWNAGTLQGY